MSIPVTFSEMKDELQTYLAECDVCRSNANSFLASVLAAMEIQQGDGVVLGRLHPAGNNFVESTMAEMDATPTTVEFVLAFNVDTLPRYAKKPIKIFVKFDNEKQGVWVKHEDVQDYFGEAENHIGRVTLAISVEFANAYMR